MTDDLVTWLRQQLDEDERVALEASRHGEHGTPTGEHWQWVEIEHDQVLTLDPMLDEYVNDGSQAALRSVEEYPTSMPYTLPHFIVTSEEVSTVCGMHIARWDPARVLAEVEAKRSRIGFLVLLLGDPEIEDEAKMLLRFETQPYAGQPGWREEWRA